MKILILCLILILLSIHHTHSFGQANKPAIDNKAIDNWPELTDGQINADGRYVGYRISTPKGAETSKLTLKSVSGIWKRDYIGVTQYAFLSNRKAIVLNGNQEMQILELGTDTKESIAKVNSFRTISCRKREYLTFTNNQGTLFLVDPIQNVTKQFDHAEWSLQSKDSLRFYLIKNRGTIKQLISIDLKTLRETPICEDTELNNLTISDDGKHIAFMKRGNENQIAYCTVGDQETKIILSNTKETIDSTLFVSGIDHFSKSGLYLYITLQEKPLPPLPKNAVMVNVWSSQDAVLQSQQILDKSTDQYLAQLNIQTQSLKRLQFPNDDVTVLNDSLMLLSHTEGPFGEVSWNPKSKGEYSIVNLQTGGRINYGFAALSISPDQNFLVGLPIKGKLADYLDYDIRLNKTSEITKNILPGIRYVEGFDNDQLRNINILGWLKEGATLICSDEYDIWSIDLRQPGKPICLTNGFGRKNHIVFRPFNQNIFTPDDFKILSAFDTETMANGFYSLDLKANADPSIIFMDPEHYYHIAWSGLPSNIPLKATNNSTWLLTKQSANSSPNLVFTKDFKTFKQVSDFHPETRYNWMKGKLMTFKGVDNETFKGVLYTPEDLDTTKRYPVILYYYERLSNKLNVFHEPEYYGDNISIPNFVSNGYLIFTPDMLPKRGRVCETAYRNAEGAADMLSKLKYVDSTKIGLQGHSFGGLETNCIVTRSNRFAAALSASSRADLISSYGSISLRNGYNYGGQFSDQMQGRIGYTLWERPDVFIENSPIFKADKMNTPLLMMNNNKDAAVNFEVGLEFFIFLRRLQKPVWLLEYENAGHTVGGKDGIDYMNRVEQFFGHYLKDEVMPDWMKKGIPAKLKGYEKGY